MIFEYNGVKYPEYIRQGNAVEHIETTAKKYCQGIGLDIGGQRDWTLKGAIPININDPVLPYDADVLPKYDNLDYIFSSHTLEHLDNPVSHLMKWKARLKEGGVLFLYLPHPDMSYWHPENNKKHKNIWKPLEIYDIMKYRVNFKDVLYSERDLYWSYSVVGIKE